MIEVPYPLETGNEVTVKYGDLAVEREGLGLELVRASTISGNRLV